MALFPDLKLNSKGGAVTRWQNFLIKLKILDGKADGQFGPKTDEATRKYQADKRLDKVDGIVGNQTYTKALEDGFNGGVREIRAVWLTNVDSNILDSLDNIKKGLERLKAMNFNTLYPVVWNRGYTLYPSDVAKEFTGAAVMPESSFEGRDMLKELITEAKALNLRVIPWFEYGLMTLPDSITEKHNDLLMKDIRGERIRLKSHDIDKTTGKPKPDQHIWFNPCRPQVQDFLVNLITDVVERYPEIDGIQVDDHFGIPVEMSYDDSTITLYQEEAKTKENPKDNPESSKWKEWRMDKVTQLLRKIFKAVKDQQGDCIISVSPNPLDFSKKFYLANWKAWEQEKLAEEIALQIYRASVDAFINEIEKTEVTACRDHIPTLIGISTGTKQTKVNFSPLIQEQIQATRNRDFAGFSCFFYETIINQIIPTEPEDPAKIPTQRELAFKGIMPPLA